MRCDYDRNIVGSVQLRYIKHKIGSNRARQDTLQNSRTPSMIQSIPTSKYIKYSMCRHKSTVLCHLRVSVRVREPSGVQLSQIIFIRLPDHLPLEFERSCDEARLGGPWIWHQLDFSWCLELLQSSLLCSLC